MGWILEGSFATKIGFATHQNAIPLIREIRIVPPQDVASLHDVVLTLTSDPSCVHAKTWRIDRLDPGVEQVIEDRDVTLEAHQLSTLTEGLNGTLTLRLTDKEGALLAASDSPIDLLAHNEWGGSTTMAELLPAFVMPNDPAVDKMIKAASDVLRSAGRPDALDGYKSKERERVWEITSAIWSALAGLRLTYALPPASFEMTGQKIRTPSQIMSGGVATCLDTALFFAAALEQAGLHAVVVVTEGHAFTGVWLQPLEFATILTEEAAALRRRIDLDDIVIFETTGVTHKVPSSFNEAIKAARRQLSEESDAQFRMAVDIRRARLQKIRPLGVVASESEASDEATRVIREGLEAAPSLPAFDTDILKDETPDSPTGRIQQWQRKLLNLTTSNNLLSIRSGKSMLRLHCPSPAVLEDMLAAEKTLRLVPMPDLAASGRDQKIYEQQNHATLADELAEQALQRQEVMSELPKDKLDAALIELFRKTRASFEEGGANTLFLAFGVLKWKKAPNDEKAYRAPLILVPVQLDRKSVQSGMTMKAHEDEARFNLTLLELLRQDFALEIPGLDGDLPKDQSGLDVDAIWRRVREAVCDMPGFEVVPEVVLGSFSFAKYLMWRDLVERGADLKESPVVHHLIERDGSVHLDDGDDFPKAEQMDQRVDPAQLFTPLPADSSQLVAVYASAEGRNFVLDGPPGTGKSQTIANIIAHNMALGRRVLFVAEKQAALDVVQRRLASKGLGPFCLELHSAKATKSAVLKQLDSAWTARDSFTAEEWAREANDIRRLRDELNDVVNLLHAPDPNGWTLHRAIGRVVRDWTDATPRLVFHTGTRHSEEEMITLRENVRRLGIARKAVSDLPSGLKILACSEWSNAWQDRLVAAARALAEAIKTVERTRDG
ncbi:DUF4011 domain-containing protein, partial [Neokomagataea thailandica]